MGRRVLLLLFAGRLLLLLFAGRCCRSLCCDAAGASLQPRAIQLGACAAETHPAAALPLHCHFNHSTCVLAPVCFAGEERGHRSDAAQRGEGDVQGLYGGVQHRHAAAQVGFGSMNDAALRLCGLCACFMEDHNIATLPHTCCERSPPAACRVCRGDGCMFTSPQLSRDAGSTTTWSCTRSSRPPRLPRRAPRQ